MPIQVHNIAINGSTQRVTSKEEADSLYSQIADGLNSENKFIEIKCGGDVVSMRAEDIRSFGIQTFMEPTQDELRQQQIERINAGYGYDTVGAACGESLRSQGLI